MSKQKDKMKVNHSHGFFEGSQQQEHHNTKKRTNPPGTKPEKKAKSNIGIYNIGWLFAKDYYYDTYDDKKLVFEKNDKEIERIFEKKNQRITDQTFSSYRNFSQSLSLEFKEINTFDLTTTYPGFLIGSGIPHESGKTGEFKIGFHFDHTTGLPYIPGSSVKGLLRSAFQQVNGEYIAFLLNDIGITTPVDIAALEQEIFDGTIFDDSGNKKERSMYKRDIFFDALIIESNNRDDRFLAEDFITPHRHNTLSNSLSDIFKAPVPLMFLKVLPQVVFKFQFRLTNGLIEPGHKKELFKKIILELGIGAKTNVGYGKFE